VPLPPAARMTLRTVCWPGVKRSIPPLFPLESEPSCTPPPTDWQQPQYRGRKVPSLLECLCKIRPGLVDVRTVGTMRSLNTSWLIRGNGAGFWRRRSGGKSGRFRLNQVFTCKQLEEELRSFSSWASPAAFNSLNASHLLGHSGL